MRSAVEINHQQSIPGLNPEGALTFERVDQDGRVGDLLVVWHGQHGAVFAPPLALDAEHHDHALPATGRRLPGLMYGRSLEDARKRA